MGEKKMPFTKHLEELRKRIIVSFVTLFLTASVSYLFSFDLLELLIKPVGNIKLHYLSPIEPLMARIKVAVFAGIVLASPVLIYELLAFVTPALKKREKLRMYPVVFLLVVLFISGVALGYYIVMPVGTKWLLDQAGGSLLQTLTVSQYISYAGWFLLALGLSFETPLVVLFLVKLGIVKRETLRKQWRYAYVLVLVIAAIVTPDWSPVTMLAFAVPMILLYELSLLLARFL